MSINNFHYYSGLRVGLLLFYYKPRHEHYANTSDVQIINTSATVGSYEQKEVKADEPNSMEHTKKQCVSTLKQL